MRHVGRRPGRPKLRGRRSFKFLAYLFLALFVAESQTVAISGLIRGSARPRVVSALTRPAIFVAALAITAFANGLWMCVQGANEEGSELPRLSPARLLHSHSEPAALLVLHLSLDGVHLNGCARS